MLYDDDLVLEVVVDAAWSASSGNLDRWPSAASPTPLLPVRPLFPTTALENAWHDGNDTSATSSSTEIGKKSLARILMFGL